MGLEGGGSGDCDSLFATSVCLFLKEYISLQWEMQTLQTLWLLRLSPPAPQLALLRLPAFLQLASQVLRTFAAVLSSDWESTAEGRAPVRPGPVSTAHRLPRSPRRWPGLWAARAPGGHCNQRAIRVLYVSRLCKWSRLGKKALPRLKMFQITHLHDFRK